MAGSLNDILMHLFARQQIIFWRWVLLGILIQIVC